jgi:hypothetical protein
MAAHLLNPAKRVFVLIGSVFLASCMNSVGNEIQATQTASFPLSSVDRAEVRLSRTGEDRFYYYVGGVRTPLALSMQWIAVKFASPDPTNQSAAAQNSILGPLEQAQPSPVPELTLVPLQENLSRKAIAEGINTLRADRASFLQVNPVFQSGDAQLILTDQFIATFPAGKEKEEIDQINSSHGVEIVEPILGQANTFVLRVTEKAELDPLAMANLYQESGIATSAAPNFVRILKK